MKKLLSLFILPAMIFIAMPLLLMAQDTTHATAVAGSATNVLSDLYNIISGYIPTWVSTLLSILAIVLPTVQLVLKRIPTPTSVKIGGIVGKILDILTFFQPDKKTDGTTHA